MINIIDSRIIDDLEREFPVEITYESRGCRVANIDYNLCPDARISKDDLKEIIKDIIREEENGIVDFI